MNLNDVHRVEKWRLETEFQHSTLKEVQNTNDLLSQMTRYNLSFILDKVLSELIGNQNIKISYLAINLGEMNLQDVEQEFPKRFEQSIRKQLTNYLLQNQIPTKKQQEEAHQKSVAKEMEILQKSLVSGILSQSPMTLVDFNLENRQKSVIQTETKQLLESPFPKTSDFEQRQVYQSIRQQLFFQKSSLSYYSDFEAFVFFVKMGYYPLFWEIPTLFDIKEQYYKITFLSEKEQVSFYESIVNFHPSVMERLEGISSTLTQRIKNLAYLEQYDFLLNQDSKKELQLTDNQEAIEMLEIHRFSEKVQLLLLYIYLKNETPWWVAVQKIQLERIASDEIIDFISSHKELFFEQPSFHFFEHLTEEQLRDVLAYFQKEHYPKLLVHVNLIQEILEKQKISIPKIEFWRIILQLLEESRFNEKDIQFLTISYITRLQESYPFNENLLYESLKVQEDDLDSTSTLLLKWIPNIQKKSQHQQLAEWFWKTETAERHTEEKESILTQIVKFISKNTPFVPLEEIENFVSEVVLSSIFQEQTFDIEKEVFTNDFKEKIIKEITTYIQVHQPVIPSEDKLIEELQVEEGVKDQLKTDEITELSPEHSDSERIDNKQFLENINNELLLILLSEKEKTNQFIQEAKEKSKTIETYQLPENETFMWEINYFRQRIIYAVRYFLLQKNIAWWSPIQEKTKLFESFRKLDGVDEEWQNWLEHQQVENLISIFHAIKEEKIEQLVLSKLKDIVPFNPIEKEILNILLQEFDTQLFWQLYFIFKVHIPFKEIPFWKALIFKLVKERQLPYLEMINQFGLQDEKFEPYVSLNFEDIRKIESIDIESITESNIENWRFKPLKTEKEIVVSLEPYEIQQFFKEGRIGERLFDLTMEQFSTLIELETIKSPDGIRKILSEIPKLSFIENQVAHLLMDSTFWSLIRLFLGGTTPIIEQWYLYFQQQHLAEKSILKSHLLEFSRWINPDRMTFSYYIKDFLRFLAKATFQPIPVLVVDFLEKNKKEDSVQTFTENTNKERIESRSESYFDNTENITEDKTESKTEDKTESKTEDKTESKIEGITENIIEGKTESKTEDKIEDKTESKTEVAQISNFEKFQYPLSDELTKENEEKLRLEFQAELTMLKTQTDKIKITISPEVQKTDDEVEDSMIEKELEGKGISLRNAGIVLIWPFLSHYFNFLGMLNEERKFKSSEDAKRAVHLIQYLAVKQTNTKDPDLILNKILCGLKITSRVPKSIQMTDKEIELAESLLQAVINQWPAIKNSTNDGLRGSFFVRNGTLTKNGDNWDLKIESKAWDILLDKLNWGLSLIKLSWMKGMLTVEWRKK